MAIVKPTLIWAETMMELAAEVPPRRSNPIVRKASYYELQDVKMNRRLSTIDLLGPLSNHIKVPKEMPLQHRSTLKPSHFGPTTTKSSFRRIQSAISMLPQMPNLLQDPFEQIQEDQFSHSSKSSPSKSSGKSDDSLEKLQNLPPPLQNLVEQLELNFKPNPQVFEIKGDLKIQTCSSSWMYNCIQNDSDKILIFDMRSMLNQLRS